MSKAYSENYKEIEWKAIPEHVQPRPRKERAAGPTFMPDIKEFVAPGMELISSRSQLRAYEQRTGTRQVGNDLKLEDYDTAKRAPKISERQLNEAAYKALQRVLG